MPTEFVLLDFWPQLLEQIVVNRSSKEFQPKLDQRDPEVNLLKIICQKQQRKDREKDGGGFGAILVFMYKRKDCVRKKQTKQQMTPNERHKLKLKVRDSVRRWRQRNFREQVDGDKTDSTPAVTVPIMEVYKTPAPLGKAKRKAMKALPISPRKRSAIVRTLAADFLNAYVVADRVHGNQTDIDAENKVRSLYESDAISRMMPGKGDFITIWDQTGRTTRVQKRHLMYTLAEAFQFFMEQNPETKIGKSKFAELRPKWVFLTANMPPSVCGCIYHSNIILLLQALNRKYPDIFPRYSKSDFLSKCVCSLDNEECMSDNCPTCSDGRTFRANFLDKLTPDDSVYLKWSQWVQDGDKFMEKGETRGTTGDAIALLESKLPTCKFIWHVFIKKKDFAENCTCTWQDEIQSAHWRQRQATVYTAMIYHRDQTWSYAIVSDVREHDKKSVAAFTSMMFQMIRAKAPHVKAVQIWTDGPSSQFKNKFVFVLSGKLQQIYQMKVCWNFFATSHGKGPNDALGGNVKRIVHRKVMARQTTVNSALEFATCVQMSNSNISVLVMNEEQINLQCETLSVDALWGGLKGFPGTITSHQVESTAKEVCTRFYTSSPEQSKRPVVYVANTSAVHVSTAASTVPGSATCDIINSYVSDPITPAPRETGDAHVNTQDNPSISDSSHTGTEKAARGSSPKRTVPVSKQSTSYSCPRCKWCHGDENDPRVTDDWIRCQSCMTWFHQSCAEEDGIIEDNDAFTCYSCLSN